MEAKWVTFVIGDRIFAFELEHVQEMIRLPQCRHVPRMGHDDLGVTMLRNKVIPVVDLAKTLGQSNTVPHGDELANIIRDRRQDHLNWLNELENSVRNHHEFKLALDPAKCKFGVWYANFKTEDPWLATLLRRMETPHAAIHALGAEVIAHMAAGRESVCLEVIENHRHTTLKNLLNLFDEAIQQVTESTRRILIVLKGRSGPLGIAVDGLQAVISISDSEIQSPDTLPGIRQFDGLIGFWVQSQTGQKIQLLDPVSIYPQLAAIRDTVLTS